jgi:hypothetical protein
VGGTEALPQVLRQTCAINPFGIKTYAELNTLMIKMKTKLTKIIDFVFTFAMRSNAK